MAADGTLRFDTSLDPEGFNSGSEKLKRSVQSLITTTNKIGQDTQKAFSSFAPSMQAVSRAFENTKEVMLGTDFAKYMTDAQGQATQLANELNKVGQAINGGFKSQKDIDSLREKMAQTAEKMQALEERMKELSETQVETEPYAELTEEFAKADAQLQKLRDKEAEFNDTGVSQKSAKYKNLQQEIEQVTTRMKNLKAEMDDMESSGTATVSGSQTQEYQSLASALVVLQNAYASMSSEVSSASAAMTAISAVTKGASIAAQGVATAFRAIVPVVTSAVTAMGRLGVAIARLPFQATAAGARGMVSAFRTMGSAVQNVISHLSKFKGQSAGVGDMASNLVSKLTSLKTLLISRVKRMFISAIMKDMQSAMTALSQKSAQFKSALSGMQTAASGLSANLASMFGGIVSALAPVVTQIISWISTIISYINALFGMLSGKGTIMTAKKNMNQLGGGAGGASKKVKELKKELMGFDEINNLKEDNDDGGGGGGSGGAGDLFEETSIDDLLPENIRNYFQKIKDAILSENWEEVGGLVADGLNYAMLKIDEAILRFQSFGVKWANIIARIMNGLVDRFNFPLLGKTLGDGFMTIIRIENAFLEEFKFNALGAGLGEAINSMFGTINWTEVGHNFALKINAFTAVLSGFLSTFKAKAAGADIGKAVNAMFDGIVWTGEGGIADTFSGGVNAVIEALDGFISEVEKGGAERRQMFADAIYQMITGVNFVQAIVTLNQGFQLIGLWLGVAFEGLTKGIKDKAPEVVDAINSLITADSFTPVAESIGTGIQNLVEAFSKINSPDGGINFEKLGNSIGEGINVIVGKVDFGQLLVAIVEGLANVSRVFWGAFSLINFDKMATDMLNGINTLITEHSFKDIISNATTGINNVIDAFGKLVGTGEGGSGINFSDIASKISEGINSMAENIKFDELIKAVGVGIGRVFVALAEGFAKTKFDTIARKIAGGINSIAHSKEINWGKFAQDLGTGLANAIRSITTFVTETDWTALGTNIGTNIGTALAKVPWGEIAGALWDLFKAAIVAAFDISGAIAEALGYVSLNSIEIKNFDQIKDYFKRKGGEAGASISDGFAEHLQGASLESLQDAFDLWSMGVDEEVIKALDATHLHENLAAYQESSGQTLGQIAMELSGDVGEAIGSGIPDAINKALQEGEQTVANTADQVAKAADTSASQVTAGQNATATADTVTSNLSSELTAGEGAVGTSAEGVTNAVDETLSTLPDKEKANAEAMMQAIQFAIDAGTPQAEQAVQTAADAVVNRAAEIMSSDKGNSIATTFVGGITSGIQSAAGGMYSQMATVGTYITAGMAHGIYSSTSVVVNAARNAALAAYRAACDYLGISSPSKLFAEIGKFTMIGWAEGQEENQSAVLDTISNTAKAMEEEAQDTEFNVSADALVSGLDIAMDRLQSIADVFSSIGDMIASVGELPIPAIATGSVLPYRTRVADGFGDSSVTLPNNVLTADNSYDVMYRAFRSALMDTADNRPIEISINGKKMADWVQKQNRIESRSRGV